ncbi:hypothetical protein QFC24_000098 [Naganishia onofrii]|uniref:Uncharacterized protein n=1 Tax=Naganishia onofrii TaxID=1851511 RepID=A0ACC2XWS1_9TREE|nr:hypothetical protein QFC24_000098 [Naganishia onofrii]
MEDDLDDLVDSAADELSTVAAKVTGGKLAAVPLTPVTPPADTLPPLPTAIITSQASSSRTLAVSASSSFLTSSDTIVSSAMKTSTPTTAATKSLISIESSIGSSTITSMQTSSTTLSTHITSALTSLTSSAKTDAQGSIIYVTSVETVSASSSSTTSLVDDVTSLETVFASASATGNSSAVGASQSATSGDGKVLSTGVIIAISVVGGVVVLAIGLFIVWKLKQKKFNGYDDDIDGIKWPELNKHGESSTMPLPAKPTGGHGFETNALERRMDLDDDGIGEYDAYPAPVSYRNSANGDHYPGYGEDLPPVPPLPPLYQMNHNANLASGHHSSFGEDAYDMPVTAQSEGVGLDRSQSNGGYPILDVYPAPLGGTGAFEVDAPEMFGMTGGRHPRSDNAFQRRSG